MKGNPDVIACLKELLRGELAARDQYLSIPAATRTRACSRCTNA